MRNWICGLGFLLAMSALAAAPPAEFNFLDDARQSPELRQWLERLADAQSDLRRARAQGRVGLLVADLSEGRKPRWAALNPDFETYGASVPKVAILLGILYNHVHATNARRGVLEEFHDEIARMIKVSDNVEAGKLYAMTSFESISAALRAQGLYDWDEASRTGRGGLWCGGVYAISEVKRWFEAHPAVAAKYSPDFSLVPSPRTPDFKMTITARSSATFLLQMEKGQLVDPAHSAIAKDFLHGFSMSKFLPGVMQSDPQAEWYGKTGNYEGFQSEILLIEGKGYRYLLTLQLSEYTGQGAFAYVGKNVNALIKSGIEPAESVISTDGFGDVGTD